MLNNRNVQCLQRTCEIYQKWDDFDTLRSEYEKFVAKDWSDFMRQTRLDASKLPIIRDFEIGRQYVLLKVFERNTLHL